MCSLRLRINHRGLIIINPNVRIGKGCDIHQGANIRTDSTGAVPTIGDNA